MKYCDHCGNPYFLSPDGVSHHEGNGPDSIDHVLDEDHIAYGKEAVALQSLNSPRPKDPFEDYKIIDGVKLYRSNCNCCGIEFYDKSPYKLYCPDKVGHKKVRKRKKPRLGCSCTVITSNNDGSWDNAVGLLEDRETE